MAATSSHLGKGMGDERKPALQEKQPNTKQDEPAEERKISALDIQLVSVLSIDLSFTVPSYLFAAQRRAKHPE
eukprot:294104-Prorocentrum_minimum.AAC.2